MRDRDGVQRRLPDPPRPTMRAEWRIVLRFSRHATVFHFESEQAALDAAAKMRKGRWRLERRMVSPWQRVGPDVDAEQPGVDADAGSH